MLRDRLICGINDQSIQKRLLGESYLDFDKALGIATSMKAAAANARDLSKATQQTDNSGSDFSEINNVSVKQSYIPSTTAKPRTSATSPNSQFSDCYRCKKKRPARP